MRVAGSFIGVIALMMAVSCEEDTSPPQMPASAPAERAPGRPAAAGAPAAALAAACPMTVEGVDVAVADSDDGAVLTFTTDRGDVTALRQRVQHLARMYEMGRGHGMGRWHHMRGMGPGHMGRGHMMGGGPMTGSPMPAVDATVTEVAGGARLALKPTASDQRETLREQARWHQQRMMTGQCWMLQDTQTGD